MKREIWYTARKTFDPDDKAECSWDKYITWSRLTHVTELVSLDGLLNGPVFEPDFDSGEDWKHIITEGRMITQFFNSLDYVLEKTKELKHFNLLAVIKEPGETKGELTQDFECIGYDLVEVGGNISALTNCGGFDESFLPSELNTYGLLSEWNKAKSIQRNLRINNPEEPHADCYLFEVWRHRTMGRKNKTSL